MAHPSPDFSDYPHKDILHPHPHDVMSGRGGGTNSHIGNQHWRMLVQSNKELYLSLPKKQKMLLSLSIVHTIRSQNPPGRFLQKDPMTNLWYDVGDQKAQEKTSQALREGAPAIRAARAMNTGSPNERVSNEAPPEDGSRADLSVVRPVAPPSAPPAMPRPVSPKGPVQNIRGRKIEETPILQNGPEGVATTVNPDDGIPEPLSGLDPFQGCSFGSLALTDAEEQLLLQQQQLYNSCTTDLPTSAESATATVTHGAPVAPRSTLLSGPLYQERRPDYEDYDDDSSGNQNPVESSASSALPQPVDRGLEPTGLSMGTVMTFGSAFSDIDPSVMMALETAGFSIGSVMSFVPETTQGSVQLQETLTSLSAPHPVDLGLEAIGMSLGSMSLAMNDNDIPPPVDQTKRSSYEASPTFLQQAKSKGSLLANIDTDDEEDESSQRHQSFMGVGTRDSGSGGGGAGQSADYEQLKAAWEAQNYGNLTATTSATYTTNSRSLMPPPTKPLATGAPVTQQQWPVDVGVNGQLVIPTTNFDRDFSQMSALSTDDGDYQTLVPAPHGSDQPQFHQHHGTDSNSFDDSAAMPPPPMRRQGSDHW